MTSATRSIPPTPPAVMPMMASREMGTRQRKSKGGKNSINY